MDTDELKYFIEAALFAAGRPLSIEQIKGLFENNDSPEKSEIKQFVASDQNLNLDGILSVQVFNLKQNQNRGILVQGAVKKPGYYDYEKYHYIEKFFDSDDYDFKKLKIKVFEINYDKFNNLSDE